MNPSNCQTLFKSILHKFRPNQTISERDDVASIKELMQTDKCDHVVPARRLVDCRFDHLFAVTDRCGLDVIQRITGADVKKPLPGDIDLARQSVDCYGKHTHRIIVSCLSWPNYIHHVLRNPVHTFKERNTPHHLVGLISF